AEIGLGHDAFLGLDGEILHYLQGNRLASAARRSSARPTEGVHDMTRLTLPKILVADALSCGAIFAIGVFATTPVAGLLGLPELVVAAGGWICLAAGALLAFLSARPVRTLLALAIVGNVAWVLASVAVWIAWLEALTPAGHAFLLAQAAAVAIFTVLEMRGLRVGS